MKLQELRQIIREEAKKALNGGIWNIWWLGWN